MSDTPRGADYARVHTHPVNLWIHVIAVPFFWCGALGLLRGVMRADLGLVLGSTLLMALSMAAQGMGHKREAHAPEPFDGPADAVRRILVEQFYRFPKFVFSGGWKRAMDEAQSRG